MIHEKAGDGAVPDLKKVKNWTGEKHMNRFGSYSFAPSKV